MKMKTKINKWQYTMDECDDAGVDAVCSFYPHVRVTVMRIQVRGKLCCEE
jgi:hypothetical protein